MILAIFGDFRVFDMTSLMTSLWRHTRYVCTFFGTNGLGRVIAIHKYHTLDVSSIGFRPPPHPGCEMGPKSPALKAFIVSLSNKEFHSGVKSHPTTISLRTWFMACVYGQINTFCFITSL